MRHGRSLPIPAGGFFGFSIRVPPASELDSLTAAELKDLVLGLLAEVAALKQTVAAQREEIAWLKGMKGRPTIKPSGMEPTTAPPGTKPTRDKPRRGKIRPRVSVEDHTLSVTAPVGSRLKGYETYLVQDVILSVRAVRYRRERWVTPDGQTVIAPLPPGIDGHFGPNLRRFVLMLYHQGQSTLARVIALLRSIGVAISERQVQRLLTERHDAFLYEARDVLRAGLASAAWISVDDTGARHKLANAFCTQIGDDRFTYFATRATKSRLNFLDLLRAGHTDYVLNDAAYDYMRKQGLPAATIACLKAEPETRFSDQAAWQAHLGRLGINASKVTPDPVRVATEAALWGSVQAHEFLCDAVILSDDAGQFNIGRHALCWVHSERLVHKLDTFNDQQRAAQTRVRALIWDFYADLKAYQLKPGKRRARALRARFDRIFLRRTGFVTLDRLLARLHANKAELLMVLERPEIPLHTNGSENDVRCHVMVESLCTPSLSVWKVWKCVLLGDAIRASVSGERCFDRRRGEIVSPDLIRRAAHDLHSRQHVVRDQLSYNVAADPQCLRGFAQGEPVATFLC